LLSFSSSWGGGELEGGKGVHLADKEEKEAPVVSLQAGLVPTLVLIASRGLCVENLLILKVVPVKTPAQAQKAPYQVTRSL